MSKIEAVDKSRYTEAVVELMSYTVDLRKRLIPCLAN